MHVVDAFDLWVAFAGEGVQPKIPAHRLEGSGQCTEGFEIRAGAGQLVGVQDGQPVGVVNGYE